MNKRGRKPKILNEEQRKYLGLTFYWYKKTKKYRGLIKRFRSSLDTLRREKQYAEKKFLFFLKRALKHGVPAWQVAICLNIPKQYISELKKKKLRKIEA